MKLKPCPFCNGELVISYTMWQGDVSICEIRHANPGKAFTDKCPMEVRYFRSVEEATEACNMRKN